VARHEHHREARRRTRKRRFQAPKAKPSTRASRGGKGELTKGFGSAREGAGTLTTEENKTDLGKIWFVAARAPGMQLIAKEGHGGVVGAL